MKKLTVILLSILLCVSTAWSVGLDFDPNKPLGTETVSKLDDYLRETRTDLLLFGTEEHSTQGYHKIPSMTASAIAALSTVEKPAGRLVFNSTTGALQYWTGIAWVSVAGGTPPALFYDSISSYNNDLTAAVSAIAANKVVLVIDSATTISGNTVVPANIVPVFINTGVVTLGAYNLTIQSELTAPPQQIFNLNGAGIVKLGYTGSSTIVRPEWWGALGDGNTDDYAAFVAACSAFTASGNSGTILLSQAKNYLCTGGAPTIPTSITLKFEGSSRITLGASDFNIAGRIDADPTKQIFFYGSAGRVKRTVSSKQVTAYVDWFPSIDTAVTFFGSYDGTLGVGSVYSCSTSPTIPSTLSLIVPTGSEIAVGSGKTLTVNGPTQVGKGAFAVADTGVLTLAGPLDAGPYQIFALTGSGYVDLSASPTKDCYFKWWGPTEGIAGDVEPQLLQAYQSLGPSQSIIVSKGLWRIATPFVYVPRAGWTVGAGDEIWLCTLTGESNLESILYVDVGAANDGISIGGIITAPGDDTPYTRWIQGAKIANLNIVGPANACKHALNLACWNGFGGTKNVNLTIGSADYAVRLAQQENSIHDIILGYHNAWLEAHSISYGYMKNGIEYEPEPGGTSLGAGTYGRIRIRKSSSWGGTRALYCNSVGNLTVEEGDVENCFYGEVAGFPFIDYNTTPANDHRVLLYSGATTRAAQTFTLAEETSIRNIGFCLLEYGDFPRGPVTFKLYNTSAGAPNAVVGTCRGSLQASSVNGGGAFQYVLDLTPAVTLPAGTYAASVEFSGGDATHYIAVDGNLDTPTDPGTCYTYDGSWHTQSLDLRFAVNVNPAIEFYNSSRCYVKPQHNEANWIDLAIDKCSEISVESSSVGGSTIQVTRSKNIDLSGVSEARILKVDPVSSINVGQMVFPTNVFGMEDGGNTLYKGRMRDWANNMSPGMRGNSTVNLMPNHLLTRFNATCPVGWSDDGHTTWTQCGTGKGDTTRHNAAYSALIEVSANDIEKFTAPAEVLNACLGEYISFSTFLKFPSGQSWGNNKHLLQAVPAYPTWAANTPYDIGDAVYENSNMFVCVANGTSSTAPNEPTWAAYTDGDYVDDNTVRWLRWEYNPTQNGGIMDDSFSDSRWHRWSVGSCFVPHNATALEVNFYVKLQASTDPTQVYMAEPTLNLGPIPTRSVQPANNETGTYVQVGANKMWFAEPAAGEWCQQGDVWWTAAGSGGSMGNKCITSGAHGSGDAWEAMPPTIP